MKKRSKFTSVIASLSLAAAVAMGVAACTPTNNDPEFPENPYTYEVPQDYCRTYYEVFVRSFADGNGDGIGDLRGLIDNLDYLNDGDDKTTSDLGINGIWMMPINQSPSYHKYDVEDYFDIDDEYGDIGDFDELAAECEKRGIWLQMDLVLNHTSNKHPWFLEAVADAKAGVEIESSAAMQRYEFVKTVGDETPTGNYIRVPGAYHYFYLANFQTDTMPDLNLKNPEVREEITRIVDFWLEHGVHSFRLDAVPWACANAVVYNDDNAEFWTWFNDYCNTKGAEVFGKSAPGLDRYCYNVGEVWTTGSTLYDFFETGMSNFNYDMGGSKTAGFSAGAQPYGTPVVANIVEQFERVQDSVLQRDDKALLSNFLSNHDNDRSAGYFEYEAKNIKMAAALYMLMPGNPYIYYGEEIGAAGSGNDPNKRLPFNWGDGRYNMDNPPGANYAGTQKMGTWAEQNADTSSILSYYRNVIALRNRFPEIGRGKLTGYALGKDGKLGTLAAVNPGNANLRGINELNASIAIYTITWKDRTILIAHNTGASSVTLDISAFSGVKLEGTLSAVGEDVSLSGGTLTLGAGTVAVLK